MKHLTDFINAYACQQKPNGCHDVLITGLESQIIVVVEDGVFGLSSTRFKAKHEHYIVADDGNVFCVHENEFCSEDIGEILVQLTVSDIKNKLAVSPVNPDGSQLLRNLIED